MNNTNGNTAVVARDAETLASLRARLSNLVASDTPKKSRTSSREFALNAAAVAATCAAIDAEAGKQTGSTLTRKQYMAALAEDSIQPALIAVGDALRAIVDGIEADASRL